MSDVSVRFSGELFWPLCGLCGCFEGGRCFEGPVGRCFVRGLCRRYEGICGRFERGLRGRHEGTCARLACLTGQFRAHGGFCGQLQRLRRIGGRRRRRLRGRLFRRMRGWRSVGRREGWRRVRGRNRRGRWRRESAREWGHCE